MGCFSCRERGRAFKRAKAAAARGDLAAVKAEARWIGESMVADFVRWAERRAAANPANLPAGGGDGGARP